MFLAWPEENAAQNFIRIYSVDRKHASFSTQMYVDFDIRALSIKLKFIRFAAVERI